MSDLFNGWPEDGEPVYRVDDLMTDDLSAARGIMHGCLAGLIMIVLVVVAVFVIAKVVQAEEYQPYVPPVQDWYLP